MANLVNQEIKENIKKEYKLRISSILMLAISISVLASTVLLLPAYLSARSELNSINYEITALQGEGEGIVDSETQSQSNSLQARTNFLNEFEPHAISRYGTYVEILNLLPKSLEYISIEFVDSQQTTDDESDDGIKLVRVSGIAPSRAALAATASALRDVDWIEEVEFPISNFSESTNIAFSLTIHYHFDQVPTNTEIENYLKDLESTPQPVVSRENIEDTSLSEEVAGQATDQSQVPAEEESNETEL